MGIEIPPEVRPDPADSPHTAGMKRGWFRAVRLGDWAEVARLHRDIVRFSKPFDPETEGRALPLLDGRRRADGGRKGRHHAG